MEQPSFDSQLSYNISSSGLQSSLPLAFKEQCPSCTLYKVVKKSAKNRHPNPQNPSENICTTCYNRIMKTATTEKPFVNGTRNSECEPNKAPHATPNHPVAPKIKKQATSVAMISTNYFPFMEPTIYAPERLNMHLQIEKMVTEEESIKENAPETTDDVSFQNPPILHFDAIGNLNFAANKEYVCPDFRCFEFGAPLLSE